MKTRSQTKTPQKISDSERLEISMIASRLGQLARGKKKTMTPAAIAHRRAISHLGVAARKAKAK